MRSVTLLLLPLLLGGCTWWQGRNHYQRIARDISDGGTAVIAAGDRDSRFLAHGWYPSVSHHGARVRYSDGRRAVITLPLERGRDYMLDLDIFADDSGTAPPQTISVFVDGVGVGDFPVPRETCSSGPYRIDIPGRLVAQTGPSHVELRAAYASRAEIPGVKGEQLVAFFLSRITITQKTAKEHSDASGVARAKPNIVVIMTDDQDDMGSLDVMQNVRSLLLSRGVRFANSFVTNPLCCPSRATFLTGQYSHNNGVWFNYSGPIPGEALGGYAALAPTASNTLPVWLQDAGYYTGLIGKYLNGYGTDVPATDVPPGWSTWIALVDPTTYSYFDYTLNENGSLIRHGHDPDEYQTDVLAVRAVDFIKARAASPQPFFLWLTPIAPHYGAPGDPVEPAPRHKGAFSATSLPRPPSFNELDLSDKPQFIRDDAPFMKEGKIALVLRSFQRRRESLLAVDEMVAKVVDALRDAHKLDDTYIVFTSDNGFFHGEHRIGWSKFLAYEESIRVPLIVRGPDVPAGATRANIVANVDLPATIVELAGAAAGRPLDGHSIASNVHEPLLNGRTGLIIEGLDRVPWDNTLHGYWSGIRTERFVYIEHSNPDGAPPNGGGFSENEFYDLQADPYQLESQPQAENYASVVCALKEALTRLKTCKGPSCWINDSAGISGRLMPPQSPETR